MRRLALFGLALFVFSIPSENGVVIPGVGSMSRLVGLLALGLTLVSLYERGRLRFRGPSLFLAVATVFLLWSATTYFWSNVPSASLARTVTLAQLVVLVWLVHQLVRNQRDEDTLRQAFVLGGYVIIGVSIAVFAGSSGGFRDVGAFNANGLAIVSALGIPLAWGLAVRSEFPKLNIVNYAYPFFALAAVVLAASRGGFLTALVAITIIPVLLPKLGTLRRVVLLVFVVAAAWGAFSVVPQLFPELQQNFVRLAETDEELLGGTLTGRTNIWLAGVEVFRRDPILGVGLGGFNAAVYEVLGAAVAPHNAFLSVAVESGLVGLTLFAGMFLIALVGIVANPVRRTENLILFAALFVAMMPTNSQNDKFAWFLVAMLASARPIYLTVSGSLTQRGASAVNALGTERSAPQPIIEAPRSDAGT